MKMAGWHEIERQNYTNDWSYMEKFKIKESPSLKTFYAEKTCKSEKYLQPYLYQYKRIALD